MVAGEGRCSAARPAFPLGAQGCAGQLTLASSLLPNHKTPCSQSEDAGAGPSGSERQTWKLLVQPSTRGGAVRAGLLPAGPAVSPAGSLVLLLLETKASKFPPDDSLNETFSLPYLLEKQTNKQT